ncbi:MAG: hypothetical protein ACXWHZ_16365 [Usitatibacter sp.]
MRLLALPIALSLAVFLAGCGGSNNNSREKITVAVIGDVPYGLTPTDTSQTLAFPGYVSALNAATDVSLVLHVGDIHSGKQFCTQDYNNLIANDWKALTKPLVYTPGDNEWSDCHKSGEGGGTWNAATSSITYVVDANGNKVSYQGGDPAANLDLVRSMFFAQPSKDFTGRMDVHSQATEFDPAFTADAKYVENVWFEKSGVMFVTLNMPGGSNNDTDIWYGAPTMSAAQAQEVANRSAANLRWLDAAFKRADLAMVIQIQADMWDVDCKTAAHLTQYKQFVDSIATHATAFGKPVLLLNGDSHFYRADNPLVQGAPCTIEPAPGASAVTCAASVMPVGNPADPYANQPNGYNVPNFHRVVVHGSATPLEWLKLAIDPNYDRNAPATATSFGPFSWQRMPIS